MKSCCDVLVMAAFHPELAPLRSALGDAMEGHVGASRVLARVVGVGLPMAAVGAAMLVREVQPRAAVSLGTCGAYAGHGLSIGDLVVARRIRVVAPDALRGLSQYPEPMSLVIDSNAAMIGAIARTTGARPADVATTLAVTVDDATAALIARATGAEVEHLEAHGVATACVAGGIPFAAVLAVANFVGASARAEWRAHHRSAAQAAADAVLRWLGGDQPLGVTGE